MKFVTPFQLLNALPQPRIASPRTPCIPCWLDKAGAPPAASTINARVRRYEHTFRHGQSADDLR